MAQITLKNIVKEYGDGFKAVNDVNLDIADGEFMIFVGPSGCGKSTTLRMVVGLEDITSGRVVEVKGWEVRGSTPVAAKFWSSLTSWATSVLAAREMSARRVERTETIMLVSPRATTNSVQATMRSRAGTEEPEVGVAEGSAGVGEEVEEDNAVDAEAGVGEGWVEGCSGSDVIAVSSPLRRRRGGLGWAARAGRGRRP